MKIFKERENSIIYTNLGHLTVYEKMDMVRQINEEEM